MGSPLHQITNEDLTELERLFPLVCGKAMKVLDDNESRTQLRRVKTILSDVRWNYGPWSDVKEIPANGDGGDGQEGS